MNKKKKNNNDYYYYLSVARDGSFVSVAIVVAIAECGRVELEVSLSYYYQIVARDVSDVSVATVVTTVVATVAVVTPGP